MPGVFAGASPLVLATKSATTVFSPVRGRPDCCVHLGGVPLPLVQQYTYLGIVLSTGIVSFIRPVPGALVKVSLSPSLLPFSSPMFSRALLLVLSSLLTILLPSSNSTSHSVAGVATFSDGASPFAAVHWEPGIGDALHLALGRALCSGSPRLRWLLHPAPCPRGYLSWLSALVTPPTAFP